MPPRWNDYRKVIGRNGFELVRSEGHETWVQFDAAGRLLRQTRASHGNSEIADKGFFKSLLKQCGKTEKHFYEVLKSKGKSNRADDDVSDVSGAEEPTCE
jgi:hypothetical protein